MRLAPRFVIAFGALASLSTAGLGYALRSERHNSETQRFDAEVRSACLRASTEVRTQADTDQSVLSGACGSGELVDRTLMAVESGEDRRVSLGQLVPQTRKAFGVDALVLVTGSGEVLAADPRSLLTLSPKEAAEVLAGDSGHFVTNGTKDSAFTSVPSIVSRCRRGGSGGTSVGLLGARKLDTVLAHIGTTMGVSIKRGSGLGAAADPSLGVRDVPPAADPSLGVRDVPPAADPSLGVRDVPPAADPSLGVRDVPPAADPSTEAIAQAECAVDDGKGGRVPLIVSKDTSSLHQSFESVDQMILAYCSAALAAALVLAMAFARTLSRPLSNLADEARKVASGEARPVRVRGTGEVAELTTAFDRMLDDLAATRRRLAATTRVAAWREVARRVAHEVKNPLAPIRAAVETLRRLRARDDPAFDEYFDEATRTVLAEVKRISDIVTEFTRFARLPPPKPKELDLAAVAHDVVKLHEPAAGDVTLRVEAGKGLPHVMADRDQIVQVLTNLVQNALDAMKGKSGSVRVVLEALGKDRVAISVCDEGPGVAPEMIARLFEPYATSKEHGTGLGLAIAQRIAMEHGGELSYVAHANKAPGAEFRMVLPVEGPPPVSEMPPASG